MLIRYDDLGSSVYTDEVPADLAAEMPALYQSAFAVVERFRCFEPSAPLGLCTLDQPRHRLVFTVHGSTARVLNRVIPIQAEAVERACASLWRAFPRLRRIEWELTLEPATLACPLRVMNVLEDLVIQLPATLEEYDAMLSRKTRATMRGSLRKLSEEVGEYRFQVLEGAAIDAEAIHRVVELGRARMQALGRTSLISEGKEACMAQFARSWGAVAELRAQDALVAGSILSRVGDHYWAHVIGFDENYARYSPGLLCGWLATRYALESGASAYHLLWGEAPFKHKLGAVRQPLYQYVFYRNRLQRVLALRDVALPALHTLSGSRTVQRLRWAVRSRTGRS